MCTRKKVRAVFTLLALSFLPVSGATEAATPLRIGFEADEATPYVLSGAERRETSPLSGKASLFYEGEKAWAEFFTTDAKLLSLEPKATYRVRFRYRVGSAWGKEGGLYLLFRVPSLGTKADAGFAMQRPAAGSEGEFSKTVKLGEAEGYVLIIGCHKNASIALDELVIEKVTIVARPLTPLSRYTQVWADEFSVDGSPAASNWTPLTGFRTKAEEQYYTTHAANLRVEKGNLVMEALVERRSNLNHAPGKTDWRGNERTQGEYTSGYIDTKKKFTFRYGRAEVRARLPAGSGLWPAIWMMGEWTNDGKEVGWPACGEIDIMEYIGVEPETIHATTHFRKAGGHVSVGEKLVAPKPFDDFHRFIIEWTPEAIHFYYDDTFITSFETAQALDSGHNPFQKPHYLILNLALGGWGGKIDALRLPAKFLVDYARVYRLKDALEKP
jgi:beta-glucanase (GH16 family)